MTLTRAVRVLAATALSSALLLSAAPTASADGIRDDQWAEKYFDLQKVWSVTKGDGIKVAVIDSGVDANNPDLTGQVLPGFDQSGRGLNTKPTVGHGTGVASVIAGHGHGDNDGILGLAPGVKILPAYKGDANDKDVIPEAIRWAVDNGAKVINISQTLTGPGLKFPDALAYAASHDVLVVAGTGNDGTSVGSPANRPGVLAVGATDKTSTVWAKSNYGPEVMLTAPGVKVITAGSCDGGANPYCMGEGTSISTAFVSATAALVRAKYPNLTAGQVANRLVKSAMVPPALKGAKLPDAKYGYGIVRPYEALTQDIPAGPEQGPLAAVSATSASPTTKASGGATNAPDGSTAKPAPALPEPETEKSSSSTPLILAAVAVVVVVLLIIIAVTVSGRKRRAQAQLPPQQMGQPPHGGAPGWPPAQQPYGNQAPPPGYSPQQPHQPYQNNPYQNGGQ
ncbi:S8 family serine peptidase [Kitasatospora camelliae]|uniref:S8 family serine peptidase n=1 Tax=Kitasatospora camelliae TaxID=3156397 RepID=A0AAU8JV55_9ACTN